MHAEFDINYQSRVIEEKKSLDEKISKLSYFMRLGIYDKLGDNEKELLQRQLELMIGYSGVLAKRMELFMCS